MGIIIVLIILYLLFGKKIGKYEGLSAEEWADEASYWEDKYSSFRSCVEDYDSLEIKDQIDYGGVFYFCD